jgi:hypothetical protein
VERYDRVTLPWRIERIVDAESGRAHDGRNCLRQRRILETKRDRTRSDFVQLEVEAPLLRQLLEHPELTRVRNVERNALTGQLDAVFPAVLAALHILFSVTAAEAEQKGQPQHPM